MSIERKRLDYNREKQVIVNLILNTKFCEKVLPVVDGRYFESKYAETLIDWVATYFESYGVAPKEHINAMFDEHGVSLDPIVHEHVGNLLQHLSDVIESEVHNIDYLIDITNDLFREKHLALQNEAVKQLLANGDLVEAENTMMEQYRGIEGNAHEFVSLDDDEYVRSCIRGMIEQQDPESAFFMFSGKLGEFIGPIDRGWFIAYLAPAKRGKTTYMLDAAIDSVRQKLNTLVISLEMPKKQLMQRYLLSVSGVHPDRKPYTTMVPIMDCKLNQNGECEKDERQGYGAVLTEEGLASYEDEEEWQVCTECRGKRDFVPSAWREPVEKENINEGDYFKKVKKFNKFFGKYGRIVHMASRTVTVSDIRNEVAYLENTQNFIPDVIVLDYADLIKPDGGSNEKRHQLDDIWEALRGWGQEKHVTIISASQTNRLSADVDYLKDTHVAEDYSKIAKLDIAIGLCQTDQMKEMGMMNINKVVHRHKEFIQSHVCTVLQEMSHQQSTLDSEFVVK